MGRVEMSVANEANLGAAVVSTSNYNGGEADPCPRGGGVRSSSSSDNNSNNNNSKLATGSNAGGSGGFMNSVWSSDGLLSSNRLFPRPSSTPPSHLEDHVKQQVEPHSNSRIHRYGLAHFALRDAAEESNQEGEDSETGRRDRALSNGKCIQRSWSAPPLPENVDDFFLHPSSGHGEAHTVKIGTGSDGTHNKTVHDRSVNQEEWKPAANGYEHASLLTDKSIAPVGPLPAAEAQPEADGSMEKQPAAFCHGSVSTRLKEGDAIQSPRTLVDRVQEDFPRTPSPVFGYPGVRADQSGKRTHHRQSREQDLIDNMNQLHLDDDVPFSKVAGFQTGSVQSPHVDPRLHQGSLSQPVYPGAVFPTNAPPGFQAPVGNDFYVTPSIGDSRRAWAPTDEVHCFPHVPYPVAPAEFGDRHSTSRGTYKVESVFVPRYGAGVYSQGDVTGKEHRGPPMCLTPLANARMAHHSYGIHPSMANFRMKQGQVRRPSLSYLHPVAHSYSATSLLEEFKNGAKPDKWDLNTIKGHLVQFARDQSGSRFIQQKLEKADDYTRSCVFEEMFPHALALMTDVFGNYVIQKLFDHGSVEEQRRLVTEMRANMISLALQVYGCRVIQKALEVTQVDEQLTLIRELRGHVMKCAADQNGNHVLQKCIEAASWRKSVSYPFNSDRRVTGEHIQFIVNAFVGQAAGLSTHAYGCRVIQRVLEHCSPHQIRPIVSEIIFKCRDLVKDQFGNYVVQHVIVHGELDQRNIVMQTVVPEIAKWSQHKYASNVVEACLDQATKLEIAQIIDYILQCDESGSSCPLLPMMKHMYGNYVVQKLLDKAGEHDRQRIECIIQHNADYLKRFTYGKHVLSRLERDHNNSQYYCA